MKSSMPQLHEKFKASLGSTGLSLKTQQEDKHEKVKHEDFQEKTEDFGLRLFNSVASVLEHSSGLCILRRRVCKGMNNYTRVLAQLLYAANI